MVKAIYDQSTPEVLDNPAQELWCVDEYMDKDNWVPCYVFNEQQFLKLTVRVETFMHAIHQDPRCLSRFGACRVHWIAHTTC